MYISVIDDSPAVLEMMEAILAVYGHTVEGYRNATSFFFALQKAERPSPFDLIIIDLFLGQQLGTDIIDALEVAQPHPIPVMLMTAAAEGTFVHIQERYPHIPILQKPFKIQSLIALIDQVALIQKKDSHRAGARGGANGERAGAGALLPNYEF
ncbi:MAG: hypothetical protein PVS3B1_12390 [Ktedonobacteraceae bacterium]